MLTTSAHAALHMLTDENAPFGYTDPASQKITGITAEMVIEAARRAKQPYVLEIFPWARAYSLAKNDPDTCVYPLVRLPERESQFQWIGPLSVNTWVLYAKTSFPGKVSSLADLEKYVIGGLLQDGPSMYLKSQGIKIDLVGDNKHNLKKLAAGRIDLWATGLHRGRALAAEEGITDIKPIYTLKEVDHYLACSPKTAESAVKALNQAVDTMRSDGWMKKIGEHYQSAVAK
ncbi:substrate-binding periplasmic protein [Piscinibacter terrae]|nr:transporter substrate-binding domain-containing protein [Albitalea terrae]